MNRTNPATGTALESIEDDTEEDIDAALNRANETFEEWRETSINKRQQLIGNAAAVLRENKQEYAELMTQEMGKPITGAVSEIH